MLPSHGPHLVQRLGAEGFRLHTAALQPNNCTDPTQILNSQVPVMPSINLIRPNVFLCHSLNTWEPRLSEFRNLP